ncbi:MAG: hypothetical protein U1F25_10995 [Rubrivivax sp.]
MLTVGGAWRNFTGDVLDLADPRRRPKAYLAFSPQQPGNEGFFDTDHDRAQHSWDRLTRPVLVGTGDGDSTCQALAEPGSCFGDLPYGRRIPFERLPPGDKALLYLHDARVPRSVRARDHRLEVHGLAAGTSGVATKRPRCSRPRRWRSSTRT